MKMTFLNQTVSTRNFRFHQLFLRYLVVNNYYLIEQRTRLQLMWKLKPVNIEHCNYIFSIQILRLTDQFHVWLFNLFIYRFAKNNWWYIETEYSFYTTRNVSNSFFRGCYKYWRSAYFIIYSFKVNWIKSYTKNILCSLKRSAII